MSGPEQASSSTTISTHNCRACWCVFKQAHFSGSGGGPVQAPATMPSNAAAGASLGSAGLVQALANYGMRLLSSSGKRCWPLVQAFMQRWKRRPCAGRCCCCECGFWHMCRPLDLRAALILPE